jgi:putative tributyrin esterase
MFRPLAACLCCLTLVSALSAQEPGPTPLPGEAAAAPRPRTIRTMRLTSEAMNSVRTYGLLLPSDYDTSARRYPVIYLLHGSGQQHATWGRRTLLDRTTGAIVVMPDMDRTRYAIAGGRVDPQAETFVTQELVDEIDRRYRTIASREGRAIGGLSIGGFGAMLLGLHHADRYSAIGAFSAPLDGLGDTAALVDTASAGPRPAIYVGCGVADSLLPASRRFAALLEGRGVARKYEEGPGAHTWEAWDWQLRSFLEMLKFS